MGKSVKMKSHTAALLICFLAFRVSAFPFGNPDLDLEWEDFKQRYNKNYELDGEEQGRRLTWEDNLKFIDEHNAAAANGEHTYEVGVNEYADWSTDELVKFMNGYKNSSETLNGEVDNFENVDWVNPSVDWVKEGYVTGVKNQAQCGSCWAFSATGSLEGQHFKKTGKLVSLSEQNLVDCEKQDFGCMGGLMAHAFAYIEKNNGIDTESSYPYTAKTGKKCLFKPQDVGATLQSYKTIPTGKEDDLQKAVASVGPVSVAIDASQRSFHFYKKGVYYEPDCSSIRLDHGVLAVGYGTDTGKDYWMVKNSWGTTWGMEGYIQMSRNRKNNCGIATAACYPQV